MSVEERLLQAFHKDELEVARGAGADLASTLRDHAVPTPVLASMLQTFLVETIHLIQKYYGVAWTRRRHYEAASRLGCSETRHTLLTSFRQELECVLDLVQASRESADKATQARVMIDACFAEPSLTVAEVAARIRCSPSQVCLAFRERFGVSPGVYLRTARLRRAERLLESTALPVKEVAYLAGFSAYRSFLRAFRNAEGCSPLEHRAAAAPRTDED